MKDQMTHAEAVSLLAEKEEEIERLRKDEKRLDWLADKNNTVGSVTLPMACVMRNLHSLRAAIDDAMLKTANAELTNADRRPG